MKYITDTAQHATAIALLNKLMGYPREADFRGRNCAPAPAGRVLNYTTTIADPSLTTSKATRARVVPVPDRAETALAADATGGRRLTDGERTTLSNIVTVARSNGVAEAAK